MIDAELEALQGKLRVRVDGEVVTHVQPELWQARLGNHLTPAAIYQAFSKAGGNGNDIKVGIDLSTSPHVQSMVEVRHNSEFDDKNPDKDYDSVIRLKWRAGNAYLSRFFLRGDDQGQHLAKHYLSASVALMRELGNTVMHVDTGEMGSYAWAKYGFVPDETGLAWVQRMIMDAVRGRRSTLLITDKVDQLTNAERKLIDAFIAAKPEDQLALFTQLSEMNRVIGDFRGKPLTVGKALLYDTQWWGALSLEDASPNYRRFCDYVDMTPKLQRGVT